MTLVKFKNSSPMGTYSGLSRGFDFPSFFNNALERFWADESESLNWLPSANIKERAQDFKIDLAVPGMDKKDFQIEVENKVLTVSGERKEEVSEENEKLTRREFHYGSFKRSFSLPETADSENINANYNNGVLTLVIGKKSEAIAKAKKQITVE